MTVGWRRRLRVCAAPMLDRLVTAGRRADRAELDQLRAEVARLRSDLEAELALIRAEEAGRER